MNETDVHLLKFAKGKEYETKCGLQIEVGKGGIKTGMPETITVWGSKVTCPTCAPPAAPAP